MNNAKKKYVSPEVNVISVDKDVITVSGDEPDYNWEVIPDYDDGGVKFPEVSA